MGFITTLRREGGTASGPVTRKKINNDYNNNDKYLCSIMKMQKCIASSSFKGFEITSSSILKPLICSES
jgi:hypothetical protein